jgi:hypothetical protein
MVVAGNPKKGEHTMSTLNHYTFDAISELTDTLNAYADAGIDPAYDSEMEELERQFAELRFSCNQN